MAYAGASPDAPTFLEDFVSKLENLPIDLRRDFALMKDLDKDFAEEMKLIGDAEKKYLSGCKKKGASEGDKAALATLLSEINRRRADVKRKQDEKVAVAQNILEVVEMYARKLNSDLTVYEAHLRSTGRFEEQGADPGREVAIKPEAHISEWILGRVIFYHSDTGYYDIADVDDSKRYHLPENQVIVLDLVDSTRKLSKGEEVLAIYPETTSFYPAVVSVAPRRTAISTEPTVSVQFQGDADEFGNTPHRLVPLKLVVLYPSNY